MAGNENNRREREVNEDDDEDPVVGRKKPRRNTWYRARHLALNAQEQFQLRTLNSKLSQLDLAYNKIVEDTAITVLFFFLFAWIRRQCPIHFLSNDQSFRIVLAVIIVQLLENSERRRAIQSSIDDLTLLRASEYTSQYSPIPPKKKRTIAELESDTEAETFTRLRKDEL